MISNTCIKFKFSVKYNVVARDIALHLSEKYEDKFIVADRSKCEEEKSYSIYFVNGIEVSPNGNTRFHCYLVGCEERGLPTIIDIENVMGSFDDIESAKLYLECKENE